MDAVDSKGWYRMKIMRIYVDTSVIGGCCDEEFAESSKRLIDYAQSGSVVLMVSDVVLRELENAPDVVRDILASLPDRCIERVYSDMESFELRDAYLEAGILGPKWLDDMTHVAIATVARADAIVSWNFKHIVRLDKMKAYNQVNLLNGYGILTIISPVEVVTDEEE
jgi:predicted nucleic acid-binding protein